MKQFSIADWPQSRTTEAAGSGPLVARSTVPNRCDQSDTEYEWIEEMTVAMDMEKVWRAESAMETETKMLNETREANKLYRRRECRMNTSIERKIQKLIPDEKMGECR